MLILLSPAKKQRFDLPNKRIDQTQPEFAAMTAQLVHQLKNYDPVDFSNLMGISVSLAERVFECYREYDLNLTDGRGGQAALFAFYGDVYRYLDVDSLSEDEVYFAQAHVRILSGLYGLLKPLDTIQPHRLEMGTKLTINHQILYRFWQQPLTEKLNTLFHNEKPPILVNLASQEYSQAINKARLKADWLDVAFKEYHQQKYKTIGIYAKRARGKMLRFILDKKINQIERLKDFDWDGYQYNESLSDTNQLCFTRVKP